MSPEASLLAGEDDSYGGLKHGTKVRVCHRSLCGPGFLVLMNTLLLLSRYAKTRTTTVQAKRLLAGEARSHHPCSEKRWALWQI